MNITKTIFLFYRIKINHPKIPKIFFYSLLVPQVATMSMLSDIITAPLSDDVVHDGKYFLEGVGAEEGDAGLLEVIEAFEDRGCRKMTTGMDDAFSFVVAAPGNGSKDVFFENSDLFFH